MQILCCDKLSGHKVILSKELVGYCLCPSKRVNNFLLPVFRNKSGI